jgi:hypothetical protein
MRQTPVDVHAFACGLIEQESVGGTAFVGDPTVRVVTKLRGQLSELVGEAGFDALLRHAALEAAPERPREMALTLERRSAPSITPRVVATLLWVLSAFIGEEMTQRLLRRVWPTVSLPSWSEAEVAG